MSQPDDRSDASLLRAAGRDPHAFRLLYDRHATAIHVFALRRVGNNTDAALEITAETFARAWYRRKQFRNRRGGTALPWLYGIAANVVRESVRRRRTAIDATERLGIRLGVDRTPTAAEPSWIVGLDEDLEAALEALPDTQRRAVVGRIVHDRTYDELATTLDCTPGAARVRVARGLDRLRRNLKDDPR